MNIKTANRLVALRKQHDMSQEILADKLGISRQAVSKWERAEAAPDLDNLLALSDIYGITLDELLKGEEHTVKPEPNDKENGFGTGSTAEENHAQDCTADDAGAADDAALSSDGENAESVRVSWNGVHVKDEDAEVHVGWKGIHVEENGGDSVHVGPGGVYINGEKHGWHRKRKAWHAVIPLVITILFFVFGIGFGRWHPSWLLFMLIPIFESTLEAIEKRNASKFAYPVLAALLFLAGGFCLGLWKFAWLVFLTIPIYYSICDLFKK